MDVSYVASRESLKRAFSWVVPNEKVQPYYDAIRGAEATCILRLEQAFDQDDHEAVNSAALDFAATIYEVCPLSEVTTCAEAIGCIQKARFAMNEAIANRASPGTPAAPDVLLDMCRRALVEARWLACFAVSQGGARR